MLFGIRKVGPFVGIGFDVVKFFVAFGIVNVSPMLRTQSKAARVAKVRDGTVRPIACRILKQRHKAWSIVMRLCGKTTEIQKRWK